jgi:N-methylhydantoinase A
VTSTRVGVDIGGTFTDLAAITPDGRLVVHKVPTTPDDPARAMWQALDGITHAPRTTHQTLIHGTTIATNALLERRGARVALVATAGFEDLLWLRRQDRASLYDLTRHHPPPLVERKCVVGVRERMGPDGVLTRLAPAEVKRVVGQVKRLKPEAVAISFLFAFRHPAHEQAVAKALRKALDVPVVASHEVLPLFREYERTSTTTAEAYLRPLLADYVGRLAVEGDKRRIDSLRIMSSSGGTLAPSAASARAAQLVLSGPAGGVVGAQMVAEASGFPDVLALDMGGTSADASLILGGSPRAQRGGSDGIAGIPLALPSIAIETVSAGGGSIGWVDDGGALRVGPRSAGAVPGPVCYGRGGTEPTVTDACLVLGWLDAAHPLAESVKLERAPAERALAALGKKIGRDAAGAATGMVEVATAAMARALKAVSVERGVDPREMALLPFGGAGPLFGCELAEALGMKTVLIPPHPGVLSALGLAAAEERLDFVAPVHEKLDGKTAGRQAAREVGPIGRKYVELAERAARELPGATITCFADCRFVGQGYELTVELASEDPVALADAFRRAHREQFGHADSEAPIEVVAARVVATKGPGASPRGKPTQSGRPGASPRGKPTLDDLPLGHRVVGPAVLPGADATARIAEGWVGTVLPSGAIKVEKQ